MKMIEKNKKIPTKNYIIFIVMILLVYALIYYLYSWYKVYSDYQKDIPVIRDSLTEITPEEANHYIQDNSNAVIYSCTANNDKCRAFEKNFKKLVSENSLDQYITYINLNGTDTKNFTEEFNNSYVSSNRKKLKNNYPAIIVFEEGKVIDILQGNENKIITTKDVKDFLEDNRVGSSYE